MDVHKDVVKKEIKSNIPIINPSSARTNKCLVVQIDLEKLPRQTNELLLICRKSILSGDIENTAQRLEMTRKAARNLKPKQQDIARDFKKVLLKITGTELEIRERFRVKLGIILKNRYIIYF